MAAEPVEHLVLRIEPLSSVMAVLAPYEKKGYEMVGMKTGSKSGGLVAPDALLLAVRSASSSRLLPQLLQIQRFMSARQRQRLFSGCLRYSTAR